MPEENATPPKAKSAEAEEQPKKESKELAPSQDELGAGFSTDEMMQAGLHLGHRASKLHPRMAEFVVGIRNTVHVIDLEKTAQYLKEALEFMSALKKEGKTLLFISTKTPLKQLVTETAKECGLPYVTERWLGGTFTNFDVIKQRAQYFKDLKSQKEKGELEKYTKKERLKMEEQLQKLKLKFGGIEHMEELPDAVFLCDIVKDKLPLKEAKMKSIKTIGIIDTNADPLAVDYPIPANDDAISSVKYILDKVKGVMA